MNLPPNKTKIVCTIGAASKSREVMVKLLLAGMNVARLNFSHGDFSGHKEVIDNLRAAAGATRRRLAIMADLPGPKKHHREMAPDDASMVIIQAAWKQLQKNIDSFVVVYNETLY